MTFKCLWELSIHTLNLSSQLRWIYEPHHLSSFWCHSETSWRTEKTLQREKILILFTFKEVSMCREKARKVNEKSWRLLVALFVSTEATDANSSAPIVLFPLFFIVFCVFALFHSSTLVVAFWKRKLGKLPNFTRDKFPFNARVCPRRWRNKFSSPDSLTVDYKAFNWESIESSFICHENHKYVKTRLYSASRWIGGGTM